MANLGGNFDASQVDPTPHFQVVPRDKYPVEIVRSEMKRTNNDSGSYLEMELEILSGPYQGRKLFDRLNLDNQNDQAVQIAQKVLSQICHATGQLNVSDSEQLHHKAMLADVRVRPARTDPKTGKTYDESNEIKGYASIHEAKTGAPAGKPAPTAGNAAPASAPVDNTPPWRRKSA